MNCKLTLQEKLKDLRTERGLSLRTIRKNWYLKICFRQLRKRCYQECDYRECNRYSGWLLWSNQ